MKPELKVAETLLDDVDFGVDDKQDVLPKLNVISRILRYGYDFDTMVIQDPSAFNHQILCFYTQFQPTNTQHPSRSPLEGIVIYHHRRTSRHRESGWKFAHGEKHHGPFDSQAAAKSAVAEMLLMFE